MFSSSIFFEKFREELVLFLLWRFGRFLQWSHLQRMTHCGKFKITNSVTLLVISVLRFFISSFVHFGDFFISSKLSYLLTWSWYFSLKIIFVSVRSAVMSLLSFLVLIIWVFFLFCFLVSQLKACQFCWFFFFPPNEPTFGFINFFNWLSVLQSIYCCSSLHYFLPMDLFCPFFSPNLSSRS